MPTSPDSDNDAATPTELVMPKLGLTMTEGLLAEWRVGVGDHVAPGDVMFVVETDKIANEIEAQSAGEIVEILVDSGATIPVGTPLARWTGRGSAETAGTAAATDIPAAPGQTPARPVGNGQAPAPASRGNETRIKATPLAKRLARQHGIDLRGVVGSGPGGRIKAADVAAPAQSALSPATDQAPEHAPQPSQVSSKHLAMARRVAAAKREVPHFYLTRRAEVSELMALRQAMNGAGGPKFTLNHFLLKAVGRALLECPEANRIWFDDSLLSFPVSDVGMVVDTPEGLFIPLLRDVGRLPLDQLALAAAKLIAQARGGGLRREDLEGGAVSVSNLGMAGVESVAPIVNPPQSSILGVGAVTGVFRPDEDGQPVLRRELALTLACDHRVFDGMSGARFLAAIVAGLETPHGLHSTLPS